MSRSASINTAILICSALIFRLLFANIGISDSETQHRNSFIKPHFSSVLKRRKQFEASDNAINYACSAVEICEENADENGKQFKFNPFFLIQFLFSLDVREIETHLKKIPFYRNVLSVPSDRYLMLQVFRI